jgi:hypothetical protein
MKWSPISDRALLCLQVPRLCRVVSFTTVVLRCRRVHSVGIMTLTEEHSSARRRTCPSATMSSTNLRLAWNRTSDTEVSLGEVLIKDRHKFQFVPHSKQPIFSQSMQFTATALPTQCNRWHCEVLAGVHRVHFGLLRDTTAGTSLGSAPRTKACPGVLASPHSVAKSAVCLSSAHNCGRHLPIPSCAIAANHFLLPPSLIQQCVVSDYRILLTSDSLAMFVTSCGCL